MSRIVVMVCACAVVFGLADPLSAQQFGTTETVSYEAIQSLEDSEGPAIDLVADASAPCDECTEEDDCCCQCAIRTIGRGPISGFGLHSPRFRGTRLVIRNEHIWAWFWQHHTAPLDPAPPLPEVDFDRAVVVVAILGLRPTGGPGIAITGAARCEGATVFEVLVNNQPGPVEMVTNPFHIAVVSRVCLPPWASILFVSHAPLHRPGMVVGRVAGVDGSEDGLIPLEAALVRLVRPGEEPEVVARTRTDEDGFYRLLEIHPGVYEVVATAEGYLPRSWPVQVHPGHAAWVDLILLPRDPGVESSTGK